MALQMEEVKDLVRTFSWELEEELERSGEPSDVLSVAVVQGSRREEAKQREVQEWRKHFEPWPVSE